MQHSHRARKRFGQNFLTDPNVIDRIIMAIQPQANEQLVEIGPGLGAMTEKLVGSCAHLSVIEIDRDLASALQERFAHLDNFSLFTEDALKADFSKIPQTEGNITVIGNLPYNISTPLLFHLFKFSKRINRMIFMLQKEVVNRICALPGERDYGRLSIMTQYHCMAEKLFEVSPHAFHPSPKVDSAIISLTPWQEQPAIASDPMLFADLVRTAFTQRRKTLRNSLKRYLHGDQLAALQIDTSLRPENLSVEDYVRIANTLVQQPPDRQDSSDP